MVTRHTWHVNKLMALMLFSSLKKMCYDDIMLTLKQRRLYFLALTALFLITVPTVIAYALGYRIQFSDSTITKTGGLFLNAYPKGVAIFVDNVLRGKTSSLAFTQGKLISGLLPKEHLIRIEKEGYASWTKKLTVEAGLVTEARNIFLAPASPQTEIFGDNVQNFIFSDSHALAAYTMKDGLVIWDAAQGIKTVIPIEKGERVGKITFGAWEDYLVIESLIKNKQRKYLLNIVTQETTDIQESELEKYTRIRQYPENTLKFMALSNTGTLSWIDAHSQQEPNVIVKNVGNFELFGDRMIYATTNPTIFYEKDLISGKTEQLTETPIPSFDLSSKILRSRAGHIAVINNKNELFLYDHESKIMQRLGERVISALFADDSKKLLWQNSNEIYVYYLRDILIQPYKKQGEVELITRFSKPVTNIAWFSYDNEHLFLIAENALKFAELDGRDQRMITDIATVKTPLALHYNIYEDELYLLDGQQLKKISLLKAHSKNSLQE